MRDCGWTRTGVRCMSQPPQPDDRTLNVSDSTPSAALPHVTLSLPPRDDATQPSGSSHRDPSVPSRGQLGRFEILGPIGRGGMGAVLRGRDPDLGRELALKILLADRQSDAEAI